MVKPRPLFQARGAAHGSSALVPSDFRQLALLLRPSGPKIARYARPAPRPRGPAPTGALPEPYVHRPVYNTCMAKLTLSVDDGVVRQAKRYAKARNTSVSRGVNESRGRRRQRTWSRPLS